MENIQFTSRFIEFICIKDKKYKNPNMPSFNKGDTYKIKFTTNKNWKTAHIHSYDTGRHINTVLISSSLFKFCDHFIEKDKWRDNQIDKILT